MFKTVLWATDGSEAADRALPYAKALAEGSDRRLVVAHVKEFLAGRAAGYPARADEDELQWKIRGQVEDLCGEGFDATLQLDTARAGNVARKIADIAVLAKADVIFVGTRGRSPLAGVLAGSVAQRLLHVALCPVLAVPAAVPAPAEAALEPALEPDFELAEAA
ncbi:MAG: universal stress protein [Gaiellaceae bacterium]